MAIQFRLRDFCYPLSILKLRASFERSQWSSPEALRDYQERLLRETVEHAFHESPYYRALFRSRGLRPADVQTLEDLPKLPTLPRAGLRSEFPRLRARNARRYRPSLHQTSGTSGEPTRFLLDKPANVLEFVYYWRHWSWAGYRLGNRFAELSSSYFLRDEDRQDRTHQYQPALGRLLLNSLSLSSATAFGMAGAMRRYRPLFLKGIASALYFLAHFFRELGVTDVGLRGVFSTGEVLLPPQRKVIEEVFRAKVYDSYGHMERTVAVSECPRGGLHVNPEYGVLELVDRRPVPDAEQSVAGKRLFRARVLGTSLHTRAMPLLRYETGDVVEYEEPATPCPCGRTLPLMRRINGRQEDVVVTPDGRVVTTLFIVFSEVAGVSIGQAVQEEPNRLVLRVVRGPEYTERSHTDLLQRVRCFVGPAMRVAVEYPAVEEMRLPSGGKFRTVLSHVASPDRLARSAAVAPS